MNKYIMDKDGHLSCNPDYADEKRINSKQVAPTYVTIEGSLDDIAHDLKQFIIWHDELKQQNEILKEALEEIKEIGCKYGIARKRRHKEVKRVKSRLEEIKANHEFRKGEGWELTTLTEDIDWLIEQAEKVERYEKALKFYANKENYELWEEAEKSGLTGFYSNVDMDIGDTAREVLKVYKVEKDG